MREDRRAGVVALVASAFSSDVWSGLLPVWLVSAGAEAVGAFGGREGAGDAAGGGPETLDGALGRLSRKRLELGEGGVDGVEVRVLGRKAAQARPGGLDRVAYAGALVASKVVPDDDVAGPQFGRPHARDVGLDGVAVDEPADG